MNYGEHITVGLGTASWLLWFAKAVNAPSPQVPILLAGAVVVAAGSIAPDIDHPSAIVSKRIPHTIARTSLKVLWLFVFLITLTLATNRAQGLQEIQSFLQMPFARSALAALLVALFLILASLALRGLGHRGLTHSVAFALVASATSVLVVTSVAPQWWWTGLGFGWGWLSHLIADGMTRTGVPLYWPFSIERWHVWPYPRWDQAGRALIVISGLSALAAFFVFGLGIP